MSMMPAALYATCVVHNAEQEKIFSVGLTIAGVGHTCPLPLRWKMVQGTLCGARSRNSIDSELSSNKANAVVDLLGGMGK